MGIARFAIAIALLSATAAGHADWRPHPYDLPHCDDYGDRGNGYVDDRRHDRDDDRFDDGDRDDRWRGDWRRDDDRNRRWESLVSVRSRDHGSRTSELVIPAGSRAIRIEGVRGMAIRDAVLVYGRGDSERLNRLIGNYGRHSSGYARIDTPRRNAVLYLTTAPLDGGTRGYVDVYVSR